MVRTLHNTRKNAKFKASIKNKSTMKAIKGFDNNLQCRDFQYEIGKTYIQEGSIKACNNGFHAISEDNAPLSVFYYYSPVGKNGKLSRYCEVEASGDIDKAVNKIACSKITIGAEIGIPGIIKTHIEWVNKHIINNRKEEYTIDFSVATNTGDCSVAKNTGERSVATNTGICSAATNTGERSVATNTGDCSVATNTGDFSVATNTGDCSVAKNTGYRSVATNTGICSAATNTGDRSVATNTGERSVATNTGIRSVATNTGDFSVATNTGIRSVATNTGDFSVATNTGDFSVATNMGDRSVATNTGIRSVATNTGDCSVATNMGDRSVATNTGDCSAACVEGKESVAIATGYQSKVKGALGCAIVVVERGDWNGETFPLKSICSAIVDGVTIKADTWYTAKDGKFVEIN